MANYWNEDYHCLAFVNETTYGETPAVPTWVVMEATRPEVNFGRQSVENLNLSVPADFQTQRRVVGGRHGGTFSFRAPLRSQVSTYVDPGESLTQNPELILLEKVMGTKHTGTNGDGDVAAGSTACVWELTAGAHDEGACIYSGDDGAQTVIGVGWVTDDDGSQTITLFEDAIGIPAAGDDIYGMYTFYSDSSSPASFSLRTKGVSDDHDVILTGCMLNKCGFVEGPGGAIILEFSGIFNGWSYATASGDGLLSGTDYMRLPAVSYENGARLTIDGASTGTADTTGTCGVGAVAIDVMCELMPVECHGGHHGIADVVVGRRTVRASFPVVFTTDWLSGGESTWDTSLEQGTTHSFMMHVGDTVGQVLSVLIPAAVVVEQAQFTVMEKKIGHQVTVEPESYSGDTGSTAPANSVFRIAVG